MVQGADVVTLVNALLGAAAILSLIVPFPVGLAPGQLFVLLITVGLVLDGLDGLVARRFGMSRAGRMLDSLSDAITFGVAPAAFVAATFGVWVVPAVLVFVACALYRLAVFTTLAEEVKVFKGLPSPVAGIALLLGALAPQAAIPGDPLPFVVVLAVILGALMVSGVEYPKIRGRYMPWLVAFAALALVHLAVYFAVPAAQGLVVASGLLVTVAVVIGAPFVTPRVGEGDGEGTGGADAAEAEALEPTGEG